MHVLCVYSTCSSIVYICIPSEVREDILEHSLQKLVPFLNHTYCVPGPASVIQLNVTESPRLKITFSGVTVTIPTGETVNKSTEVIIIEALTDYTSHFNFSSCSISNSTSIIAFMSECINTRYNQCGYATCIIRGIVN